MTAHVFTHCSNLDLIPEIKEFYGKLPQNQQNSINQYVNQSIERIEQTAKWIERDFDDVESQFHKMLGTEATEEGSKTVWIVGIVVAVALGYLAYQSYSKKD